MTKLYVLDTSVLISNPYCLDSFPNENIVIPASVLNELDKIKTRSGDAGRNARVFIRLLDELSDSGDIRGGVKTDKNTTIQIDIENYDTSNFGDASYVDNKILACASYLNRNNDVTVVSGDINMRVRAKAFGMSSQNFDNNNTNISDLYSGQRVIYNTSLGNKLKKSKMLHCSSLNELTTMAPNECVFFKDENDEGIALGRRIKNDIKIISNAKPWGLDAKNVEQAYTIDLLMDPKVPLVTLSGKAGTGKAQPLDAKILTPTGYVTMGSVKPGDIISSTNGKIQKITAIHPQGIKDIYRVYFSDNSSTECCDDHLWLTKTCTNRWKNQPGTVKSLKKIRETLKYSKSQKRNHSIPMVKPIKFQAKKLPIEPYLLGCLLGDGALSINDRIGFSTADIELINICTPLLPSGLKFIKKSGDNYDYMISKGYKGNQKNSLLNSLKKLEVMGHKSDTKSIPYIYKYNTIKNRLSILQGLMDTDGFCGNKGKYENIFYTTSKQLALDVQFLTESLGGKATISNKQTHFTYNDVKKAGLPSYAVHISMQYNMVPFKLKRKLDKYVPRTKYLPTRYIDRIEYIGKKEAQCISVDSENHLYITNNFIVTHNTLVAVACGLESVMENNQYNNLLVYRPIQPVGTDMGYLPGELADKLEPWMAAIHDSMDYLTTRSGKKKNGGWRSALASYGDKVSMEALTYIRGRSIANSFIIMDETQNVSKEEIKTILTRVGYGTKIVLTGDIEQIDNNDLDAMNNGLSYVIDKCKDSTLSGHVTLTKGERSPLATYAADVL